MLSTLATTVFKSSTRGASTCRRLKASSWRVRVAAARVVAGEVLPQQLRVAGDRRQDVVEVVSDAARQ